MFIAGPFNREVTVILPISDSSRTLGDYRLDALNLAQGYAEGEGLEMGTPYTEWDPAKRTMTAIVPVTVFDRFDDLEEEKNPWDL